MFQTRLEWLQWRHDKVGSSDAPIIMGESKYKTPRQLYEQKIVPFVEDETSFIQNAGNDAETKLRKYFEERMYQTFAPAVITMPGFPRIHASLDGQSEDKSMIVEFKLMGNGGKANLNKPQNQKWNRAKLDGIVPRDYWIQIQEQLMVTGASKCYFVSYLYDKDDRRLQKDLEESKVAIVEVLPDPTFHLFLHGTLVQFLKCVDTKTPPPLLDREQKWK